MVKVTGEDIIAKETKTVAGGRYVYFSLEMVSLLQEYVENLYFTDAVEIPGLVEPQFHKSVHLEVE